MPRGPRIHPGTTARHVGRSPRCSCGVTTDEWQGCVWPGLLRLQQNQVDMSWTLLVVILRSEVKENVTLPGLVEQLLYQL